MYEHGFHVVADITGFGERGRIGDGERNIENFCQRLSQKGFSRPGRSDKENIALFDLHIVKCAEPVFRVDAFEMIVHGDREGFLGVFRPITYSSRAFLMPVGVRGGRDAFFCVVIAAMLLRRISTELAMQPSQMYAFGPAMML